MIFDPNWVSAIAALAALGLALWANRSANDARQRADELDLKNAELTEAQTRLAHQSWSDEYFREITSWACSVCVSISEAIHLLDEDDQVTRRKVLVSLSASIDMGRWYFPNRDHESKGQGKEPAYRGVRQPCLDWIVEAYDVVAGNLPAGDRRNRLVACQRQFVSCIQEVLDPRSREIAIERVLKDFSAVSSLPKVKSPE